jgi:hypothetical protein
MATLQDSIVINWDNKKEYNRHKVALDTMKGFENITRISCHDANNGVEQWELKTS